MQTIEERADMAIYKPTDRHLLKPCEAIAFARGYELGAIEQKAIDIDIASIILCRYVCPHRIDSNKCLNSKCNNWEIFRKMMEEYTC